MKTILIILAGLVLSLFAGLALATSVQADAPAGATQCGFYLDGSSTATVVSVTSGTCKLVLLATLAPGNHSVTADARIPDPIWGLRTTAKSTPFDFVKPGGSSESPPSAFRLVP